MSEQTDKVVAEILTKAMEAAQATGAFVVEQGHDVVQQLLLFHTIKSWGYVGLGLVFMAAAYPLGKSGIKAAKKDVAERTKGFYGTIRTLTDSGYFWAGNGSAVAAAFIGLMMVSFNFLDAIKITLAPKVWLLEYAARLVS